VEGSELAVIFIEQSGGVVSWRSRNGMDVSRLAQEFGGGGHEAAAGATVTGGLDDVVRRVVVAALAALASGGPGAA
jgi:phosphoesterase RecJ-like protein